VLLLTEEGTTFVPDAGAQYQEVARNDLGEMALASPSVARDALYIRPRPASTRLPIDRAIMVI
jgi:hypothetical protein